MSQVAVKNTESSALENVSGALLITEYLALKKQEADLKERIGTFRDAIVERVKAGVPVENDKVFAKLTPVDRTTFNVDKVISVARANKLAMSTLLNAKTAAVKKLPAHILAKIPFTQEVGERLDTPSK